MSSLNICVLVGCLTKIPELRYTQSGTAVATFTLAVDRPHRADKEKEADFIPIVTFQKTAEACANYLDKGSLVAVDGRIQVRRYDDKQQQKRIATEVIAESVKFLSKKESAGKAIEPVGKEVEFDDDSIPF